MASQIRVRLDGVCDQPAERVDPVVEEGKVRVRGVGCDGEAGGAGATWFVADMDVRGVRFRGDSVASGLVKVRVKRLLGDSAVDGSVEVRVDRLVGDSDGGGGSKSLGWFRVATMMFALRSPMLVCIAVVQNTKVHTQW